MACNAWFLAGAGARAHQLPPQLRLSVCFRPCQSGIANQQEPSACKQSQNNGNQAMLAKVCCSISALLLRYGFPSCPCNPMHLPHNPLKWSLTSVGNKNSAAKAGSCCDDSGSNGNAGKNLL
jgi:hypothetical protein